MALAAVAALSGAFWLGQGHPQAPVAVLAGIWLATLMAAASPRAWLFWLPALFPLLNFYPWTGWWLVDESDLLVLAILAGGSARCAWRGPLPGAWHELRWLPAVLAGTGLFIAQAVWRGWADAPSLPPHTGWRDALWQGLFADHLSAWNSVRVAKSFIWSLCLVPLMMRAIAEDRRAAGLAFVRGMLVGLTLVGLTVLWERGTQVGVFDFVSGYRTSAAFWEMHVGGGAIDAYLALAAPLSLWAVWTSTERWRAWLALVLLWLTVYTVLTTYSRGVLGAFVVVVLCWAWMARRPGQGDGGLGPGPRRVVVSALVALLVQGSALIISGAFWGDRLQASSKDLLGRWAHWERGAALLRDPVSAHAGPWGGLGMGRFTAQYRGLGMEGELPGQVRWQRGADGQGFALLAGPDSRPELALHFSLLQRVPRASTGGYVARLRLAGRPGGQVRVAVCQRHLVHTMSCRSSRVAVVEDDLEGRHWQTVTLEDVGPSSGMLSGRAPDRGAAGVVAVYATSAGQTIRLLGVELLDSQGVQLLRNTRFSQGLEHWMPAAEAYYQPWHIDNLYLDLLLELGLPGSVWLAAMVGLALAAVARGLVAQDPLAWAFGAALLGFCAVGTLISVSEIPRVMLLALLTAYLPLALWTKRRTACL